MSHARRPVRAAAVLALAIALGWGVTAPSPTEAAGRFELSLSDRGDFVGQKTLSWCVGASLQMMQNILAPRDDRSTATQTRLQRLAQAKSPARAPGRPARKGASVHGWAAGLNELGHGPYLVVGYPTIEGAMRAAARSMRRTGKPVGLLVWAGRHAWVMSGYRATADPLLNDRALVTAVRILDPLHPRGSSTWGPSPEPERFISIKALGRAFVPRRRSWTGSLSGMFVIVQPVATHAPLRAAARWVA